MARDQAAFGSRSQMMRLRVNTDAFVESDRPSVQRRTGASVTLRPRLHVFWADRGRLSFARPKPICQTFWPLAKEWRLQNANIVAYT